MKKILSKIFFHVQILNIYMQIYFSANLTAWRVNIFRETVHTSFFLYSVIS